MLALLVSLAVAGLISAKMIPDGATRQERFNEKLLRSRLAEIRQAFDLKFFADASFNASPTTIASINVVLKQLEQEKFLRSASLTDEIGRPEVWGTSPENYWRGAGNVLINHSFESILSPNTSMNEIVASWTLGTFDSLVASDPSLFPSKSTDEFDDYCGQNKLGTLFLHGTSLKITR